LKILFICHRFPYPPKRGGKIRPFNIIKHLSQQGHEVTVVSLARSREEEQEGQGLAPYCVRYLMERMSVGTAAFRMLVLIPSGTPSSMGYFYSPVLARRIRETLANGSFDLVFVHCAFAAQYVANIVGIAKLLDFGDMDSQKWLAYAKFRNRLLATGYWLEGIKLQRQEKMLAREFDLCTCTTQAELETLNDYRTGARTGWFPNGVDSEYFTPTETPYDPNTICFIGRMDYYPNQQAVTFFARCVLPLIREHRPRARFLIIGARPSWAVRKLQRLPGVVVTGSVPDVRPLVWGSALSVAPLTIARGTQNKILESMAMGVPVVASTEASRGVDAAPGKHLLTASSPETYRDAVLNLMEDTSMRARFAEAGRKRVLERHSWVASLKKLDVLIAECIDAHDASRQN
jgi:sugar transferase (PEP-CTERM/EpsH1 system associated)